MLDFQQIKNQYPLQLQVFERAILREYLQYKILQAIFESKLASKVTFIGETALRILHGNQRFSEDIDLDNSNLTWENFADLMDQVSRFLSLEGFNVELTKLSRGAYHCSIRFLEILFEQGISPHRSEKILIQVDTTAQGYGFQPDVMILNKFDVFTQVRSAPLDLLLAQKIFTAVNRKQPMGRDFYDITFLFGLTRPDFGFLNQKLGVGTPEELRHVVLEHIQAFDFENLARDVTPFLIDPNQVNRVKKFKTFWEDVRLA